MSQDRVDAETAWRSHTRKTEPERRRSDLESQLDVIEAVARAGYETVSHSYRPEDLEWARKLLAEEVRWPEGVRVSIVPMQTNLLWVMWDVGRWELMLHLDLGERRADYSALNRAQRLIDVRELDLSGERGRALLSAFVHPPDLDSPYLNRLEE